MPSTLELTHGKRSDQVRAMFSAIAPTYDRLNHLLSLNRDRAWRRTAIHHLAPQSGERLLDLCAGTGDLAIECIARQPGIARVVVADFSLPMLRIARAKLPAAAMPQAADALRLPYRDGAFDAVMIAFGARNLEDLEHGVGEMHRVLRAGGRLLVLEFFKPVGRLLRIAFGAFFRRILPLVGRAVSGHGFAYNYLAESIESFITRADFEALLNRVGFVVSKSCDLDAGIASFCLASKSEAPR